MSDHVRERVREVLRPLTLEQDAAGRPRIVPPDTAGVAAALSLASTEGWRVRIEGRGGWEHADTPADLVVSTAALDRVVKVAPGDLVATVEAGAAYSAVNRRLADEGVWLAWDPPGRAERSIGSIVATGTAGPLRHRFGPIRDHLLGCTVVTGDGRIVKPGGQVVKNVAGFDLTRFMAGSFGAFGIVTELHLRLRARPAHDLTVVAPGSRDTLTLAGRDLMAQGLDAVALELLSPALAAGPEWVLALRLAGTEEGVRAEAERIGTIAALSWTQLSPEQAGAVWTGASRGALAGSITLRLGVLLEGQDEAIDLVAEHLDTGLLSAGAGSGSIRWTGDAPIERLRALRHAAARREIPVTLERAPWELRQAFGHFGAYREGVGGLVARLRATFDPQGALQVAVNE
ncbi:MAG TPA: FAD-binding oxidoreductase [Gemmatimonadales bacterium]